MLYDTLEIVKFVYEIPMGESCPISPWNLVAKAGLPPWGLSNQLTLFFQNGTIWIVLGIHKLHWLFCLFKTLLEVLAGCAVWVCSKHNRGSPSLYSVRQVEINHKKSWVHQDLFKCSPNLALGILWSMCLPSQTTHNINLPGRAIILLKSALIPKMS